MGLVSKLLSPWQTVFPMPKEASRVGWVPGASMILRRTMLEEIGLLDEGLYTYFDDPDICSAQRIEQVGKHGMYRKVGSSTWKDHPPKSLAI